MQRPGDGCRQRGFPGPIGSPKGHDFARLNGNRDVIKRFSAAECFANVLHFNHDLFSTETEGVNGGVRTTAFRPDFNHGQLKTASDIKNKAATPRKGTVWLVVGKVGTSSGTKGAICG